jgi:hypothetical protein
MMDCRGAWRWRQAEHLDFKFYWTAFKQLQKKLNSKSADGQAAIFGAQWAF